MEMRQGTFSSQIIAEMHLVAQPVGLTWYPLLLQIPCWHLSSREGIIVSGNLLRRRFMDRDKASSPFSREDIERLCRERGGSHALNLQGQNLRGINLANMNLSGAQLVKAELSEANLSGANLCRANLRDANLEGANLSQANLKEAWLVQTNLSGANLSEADLNASDLSEADLSHACLDGANLQHTFLCGADLNTASLCGARLDQANVSGADLSRANLENTSCCDTCFSWSYPKYENVFYDWCLDYLDPKRQPPLQRIAQTSNVTSTNTRGALLTWTLPQ